MENVTLSITEGNYILDLTPLYGKVLDTTALLV